MKQKEIGNLVEKLLTAGEITFIYDDNFIEIFEHSEGGYEGNVYKSEEAFNNEEEPLDGGICSSIVGVIVLSFFMDISREITDREIRNASNF